jgi:dolichol-phosphate mannosyltransferase
VAAGACPSAMTRAASPIRGAVSDAGGMLARAMLPVPVAEPMSGYFALPRPPLRDLTA